MTPNDEIRPSMRINNREYYNVPECAKALGLSDHTLHREIYRKNIRFLRHSRGIFILPEWADECLPVPAAPFGRPNSRANSVLLSACRKRPRQCTRLFESVPLLQSRIIMYIMHWTW